MAAALSPGSLLVKPCSDRQTVGHSLHPRTSIAVAHSTRASCSTVRPSSVSCQACTPSDTSGKDRNTGFGSSHSRAGPSGNAEAAENTSEKSSSSSRHGDHSQHQGPHSSNPESGPPGVTSESLGTVVICGWLGSNKRYLKKYQDWWTDNRYASTTSCSVLVSSTQRIFSRHLPVLQMGASLVHCANEGSIDTRGNSSRACGGSGSAACRTKGKPKSLSCCTAAGKEIPSLTILTSILGILAGTRRMAPSLSLLQ